MTEKKNLSKPLYNFLNIDLILIELFKIKIPNDCQIVLISSYRPPNANRVKRIEKNLPQFDCLTNTIIIGDLNFDMFNATDSKKMADFNLTNGF